MRGETLHKEKVFYPNVGTHTLQVHAMNTKEQPERKVRGDDIDMAMTGELNSGTSVGMGLVCKGLKRETMVLVFSAQLCKGWDYVKSHRRRRQGCSSKAKCHASPGGRKQIQGLCCLGFESSFSHFSVKY